MVRAIYADFNDAGKEAIRHLGTALVFDGESGIAKLVAPTVDSGSPPAIFLEHMWQSYKNYTGIQHQMQRM